MNPSAMGVKRCRGGCACSQATGPAWLRPFAARPALLRAAVELVAESLPE